MTAGFTLHAVPSNYFAVYGCLCLARCPSVGKARSGTDNNATVIRVRAHSNNYLGPAAANRSRDFTGAARSRRRQPPGFRFFTAILVGPIVKRGVDQTLVSQSLDEGA
jgi:hypothetical protein